MTDRLDLIGAGWPDYCVVANESRSLSLPARPELPFSTRTPPQTPQPLSNHRQVIDALGIHHLLVKAVDLPTFNHPSSLQRQFNSPPSIILRASRPSRKDFLSSTLISSRLYRPLRPRIPLTSGYICYPFKVNSTSPIS